MAWRLLGYVLVGIALVLLVAVVYLGGVRRTIPLVFSPSQILGATWRNYKLAFVEPSTGRTLDPSRGNITTSEGEAYTMLRAVWMDDQPTFDRSWKWTKDNLNRPGDRLSAWLFGQRQDGSYGTLTAQGGGNSASDADTDLAVSLVFAYARWQDKTYLGDARVIAADIWDKDVMQINGKYYLTADDLEKTSTAKEALINVSYLSPYAYRIFAVIDPGHPWGQLINDSYDLIGRSLKNPVGTGTTAGLPPDWLLVNKTTGALSAPSGTQTTNFSYDALRLPWRLALDYTWYADPRDKDLLSQMTGLSNAWQSAGKLGSVYAHDGTIITDSEAPAIYGGTIGYFTVADPAHAPDVYRQKLQYLFNPNTNAWIQPLSYYDDNWVWFGIGLYNNLLPNLYAGLPQKLYEL